MKNSIPQLPENAKLISDLPGYEQYLYYAINTEGQALTCRGASGQPSTKWSPMSINKSNKYKQLRLSLNNKRKYVAFHRLVGKLHIPNPHNYPCLNHKDGIKHNCHASNLEWCTYVENANHALRLGLRDTAVGARLPNALLDDNKVMDIKKRIVSGESNKDIALYYKIDRSIISRIRTGSRWKHVI